MYAAQDYIWSYKPCDQETTNEGVHYDPPKLQLCNNNSYYTVESVMVLNW